MHLQPTLRYNIIYIFLCESIDVFWSGIKFKNQTLCHGLSAIDFWKQDHSDRVNLGPISAKYEVNDAVGWQFVEIVGGIGSWWISLKYISRFFSNQNDMSMDYHKIWNFIFKDRKSVV